MVLRFRMYPAELFITGVVLVLITIILISLLIGLWQENRLHGILFLISIALAIILGEFSYSLSSSSAALPACRNGFIVATNGSTGEAHTCTPLVPDPLAGGGEGVYFPTP